MRVLNLDFVFFFLGFNKHTQPTAPARVFSEWPYPSRGRLPLLLLLSALKTSLDELVVAHTIFFFFHGKLSY